MSSDLDKEIPIEEIDIVVEEETYIPDPNDLTSYNGFLLNWDEIKRIEDPALNFTCFNINQAENGDAICEELECPSNFTAENGTFMCNETIHEAFNWDDFHIGQNVYVIYSIFTI